MGQRKLRAYRCPGCGLHDELCLCPSMPRVSLETGLVIVQHYRERHKPTNTARLAQQMLVGAQLIHYGARDQAMETGPLDDPDVDYLLLFQREDSIALDADLAAELSARSRAAGRRRALVVLDGTWHQCSRMARRAPRIADLPCYALPPGAPGRWRIRTPPRPGAICTLEAITRAMALFHGEDALAPIEGWFDELIARLWQMRGYGPGEPGPGDADPDAEMSDA
ncbi:MAG: DTW domain-containing protein [Myxococcales bacterium]|nr:DTW domain-containing protein [Myxococcales bacterium]